MAAEAPKAVSMEDDDPKVGYQERENFNGITLLDRFDDGVAVVVCLHLLCIVLFGVGVDYDDSPDNESNLSLSNNVSSFYSFYTDVAFMIFIGFGFLMTFLKRYMFSAVGFTFLVACFVVEWALLVNGFYEQMEEARHGHDYTIHHLNIVTMIDALFASGCVLISFGAVLGKISPIQLVLMAFLEIPFYGLNFFLGFHVLEAIDMGGSMFVHAYGAYFGVAASVFLSPRTAKGHPRNSSSYISDTFAMLGSIYLWVLWPSFNGALAPSGSQFRVVVNTVLSLSASAVTAFMFSRFFRGPHKKFDMIDIQNATLAGGVAVGSSSDLVVGPSAAIGIGTMAGAISVLGYIYLQPALEKFLGIQDTCGVHNLHGIPGIMGGTAGIIASAAATESIYGNDYDDIFPHGRTQPGYQTAALFITLFISISSGLLVGFLLSFLKRPKNKFADDGSWEMPEAGVGELDAVEYENKKRTVHQGAEIDVVELTIRRSKEIERV